MLALSVIAFSCNINKQADAIKLSNDLSAANDSLAYYGKMWNEELKIAVNTSNFSNLKPIRTKLQDYINSKEAEVSAMHDIGGSEQMRHCELDILGFEKNVVQNKFIVFEGFTDSSSDEQITNAYRDLLQMTGQEEAKMANFQKLQDEYADKNDIPKPIGEIK